MNKTYEVHQLKNRNVNAYAVSSKVVKSNNERRYTGGGAGPNVRRDGTAERFGPPLNSLVLSFSRKKVQAKN